MLSFSHLRTFLRFSSRLDTVRVGDECCYSTFMRAMRKTCGSTLKTEQNCCITSILEQIKAVKCCGLQSSHSFGVAITASPSPCCILFTWHLDFCHYLEFVHFTEKVEYSNKTPTSVLQSVRVDCRHGTEMYSVLHAFRGDSSVVRFYFLSAFRLKLFL